jgi:hypothetical protein
VIGVGSVLTGSLSTCLRAPKDRPGPAAPHPRIERGMRWTSIRGPTSVHWSTWKTIAANSALSALSRK